MSDETFDHIPVLWSELVGSLGISDTQRNAIVDETLGLGGHAVEVIRRLHAGDIFIGIDLDRDNLSAAGRRIDALLAGHSDRPTVHLYHGNFRDIETLIAPSGVTELTAVYYDLGVSSPHYDEGERGFSFRFAGPLDMRFDRSGTDTVSARDIVNGTEERDLTRILREYGEEPRCREIARAIALVRPLTTTEDLARVIRSASHDPKAPVRVFQAIRIATNHEFEAIGETLPKAIRLLQTGGRCSVITFHSLEDRIVKQILRKYETEEIHPITGQSITKGVVRRITKKPLVPSDEEIHRNPRARSAKLRIIEKN